MRILCCFFVVLLFFQGSKDDLEQNKFTYLGTQIHKYNNNTYIVEEYYHNLTGMEFIKVYDDHPNLRSFLISKTEVTQGVWQKIMGTTPWKEKKYVKESDSYAATYISWSEAKSFCDVVGLELPTRAQWEYIAQFTDGDKLSVNDSLWHRENSYTEDYCYEHQVAQQEPNILGVYDMDANVYEWCDDWHYENCYRSMENESYCVDRQNRDLCESNFYFSYLTHAGAHNIGFRLSFSVTKP